MGIGVVVLSLTYEQNRPHLHIDRSLTPSHEQKGVILLMKPGTASSERITPRLVQLNLVLKIALLCGRTCQFRPFVLVEGRF